MIKYFNMDDNNKKVQIFRTKGISESRIYPKSGQILILTEPTKTYQNISLKLKHNADAKDTTFIPLTLEEARVLGEELISFSKNGIQ